ncbi:MAG: dihydroorotate dehydrogenase [Methylobacteriaceae bacterium]|jgi:dihydroorotate dehydrogenase (NAD+) catalytic subunit|nr:dihydroorotate dehydrogenase [Methylobacteriaceae bacterium]
MTEQKPVDMSVKIGGITLANPVMPASGTFEEGLARVFDLNRLGALVTKTVTAEIRKGNPVPRAAESANGLLNAIGIPSKGIPYYLEHTLPFYRQFTPPVITSISAPTVDGFAEIARAMSVPGVSVLELNISCPNIEEGGRAFGLTARGAERVVKTVKAVTKLPVWAKLTPNSHEVPEVALAALEAGAEAVVVANTVLALAIDAETFTPVLGNVLGGLSGPAIKPVNLRHVYQTANRVQIPVIGCGGISNAVDAVEYMLAGATAVQVGTASFIQPNAMPDIIDGLAAFCRRKGIGRVAGLTGALITKSGEKACSL